jgi:methyltransferase (TIGR00027 family)
MPEPLIANVSDTARWVAVYRALESARPDALFKDPFAERLAGERGRAIAAVAPKQMRSGWPLIMRTKLMDDLIGASIAEGCDCVLNLAAGFDARPYRLPLPPALHWIEADLPAMIEEKEKILAGETPACRLSREKIDLADPAARAAFLARVLQNAAKALIITEGLLGYLDDEVVRALGRDLLAQPGARWWLLDVASPVILQMLQKGMGQHLTNAPLKFAPANGVAFFEELGWQAREMPSVFREAARHRRLPFLLRLLALLPGPDPRNPRKARWSAVVRFERG